MPIKQKAKYLIDFSMTILLPLLMAYTLVGEAAHEWLGMAMLALFILHHALNFRWLKNLPCGRYSGFRILQTVLAVLIFLTMLGSMVSGILMSRYVFGFLHLRMGDWTQRIHLFCAYWGISADEPAPWAALGNDSRNVPPNDPHSVVSISNTSPAVCSRSDCGTRNSVFCAEPADGLLVSADTFFDVGF